jgi:L-asparaginase
LFVKASVVSEDGAAAPRRIVVLGMGGTIAGKAARANDNVGYKAGEVSVDDLLAGLPLPARHLVEAEQVCQIDSKDLAPGHWQALLKSLEAHLARPEVVGVVITHGTDTLEETAYLLHRVLAPAKPVVLTAAMRPATALSADGPRNLAEALEVAAAAGEAGQSGTVVALAGRVWAAAELRKVHSHHTDAFDAGDAGPLALVEAGRLRVLRPWPAGDGLGARRVINTPVALWPQVDIVTSHAGANGRLVKLLMTAGVDGLVVAGSGNGSVHGELEAALLKADRAGVRVLRSSRCVAGGVIDAPTHDTDGASPAPRRLPSAGQLTPVQARIELVLELLARPSGGPGR